MAGPRLAAIFAFVLGGCTVHVETRPLPVHHPAHPDAAVIPYASPPDRLAAPVPFDEPATTQPSREAHQHDAGATSP